uniref:non-specific serine/threonine protein kinase n=1 Tax=Leersia perrieri TaxID=77586 RepID=A0A0D9Y1R2_9ORYZ
MPPPFSLILPFFLLAGAFHAAAAAAAGVAAVSEVAALMAFKNALTIPPTAADFFSRWDAAAASPCNFTGVDCRNSAVTAVAVEGLGVAAASVPFDVMCASLTSLSKLSLPSNSLAGVIAGVEGCVALEVLDLAFNGFSGEVPDLSPLVKLRTLNVSQNAFTGDFPWPSLVSMPELTVFAAGDNGLLTPTSNFPNEITKLTNLKKLYLSAANIGGVIPSSIGNLVNLVDLELSDNHLAGEIPPAITNLTNLTQLELYNNSLHGELPAGFGKLSKLQFFDASMNKLTGGLAELRSLTNLVSLQLFYNGFSGEVPPEFGDFKELVNLSLYNNNLTGELPANLGSWAAFDFIDVSTNSLSGPIPTNMCKRGTMTRLLMLENRFSGEIPATYGSCTTLKRFRVSKNAMSGDVPVGIWALPNLNIIDLADNQFTGGVGAGIGKAASLNSLYLAGNGFSGEIPPAIGDAASLESIDISSNRFSGEIPASIGRLSRLGDLNISRNGITGEIPASIGNCSSLTTVDLSVNKLAGVIPPELGTMPGLNSLDISRNFLSGEVPASLAGLKLSYLNLSDNNLVGAVPSPLAIAAYGESFQGNPGLCATNGAEFLRRCSPAGSSSAGTARTAVTCLLAGLAVVLAAVAAVMYVNKRRRDAAVAGAGAGGKVFGKKGSWDLKSFRVLAFDEHEVIDGVRDENLIGSGGSGNVYRVKLGTGAVVAVKHVTRTRSTSTTASAAAAMLRSPSTARRTASVRCREFDSEVGTLSSIRHVNVVKLLCSITSDDGAASLLVYEHLPNGSLYDRLHGGGGGGLRWPERYEIAVGAARGLEYLHHGCDRPILHRDVKSSNILLDESFKPRIADFGLAKILAVTQDDVASSGGVVAGTLGYMAPEYAYTWKVTEKSDVYSFGVVLLELVTGRTPIMTEYGEGRDIVDWVARRLDSRDKVMSLLDTVIGEEWEKEEAVRVLHVAVVCTSRTPSMRPSMRSVVQMLEAAAIGREFSTVTSVKVKVIP